MFKNIIYKNMFNILKEIKYFVQRGRYGYCDRDLWDFQNYLSEIIPPALRKLKENNTGCPSEFWDENKKNEECHEWLETLEEIAQGFESAQKLTELDFMKYVKSKKHPDFFTHEIDEEKAKLLTQKYERGMKLFSKYFLNLWD